MTIISIRESGRKSFIFGMRLLSIEIMYSIRIVKTNAEVMRSKGLGFRCDVRE